MHMIKLVAILFALVLVLDGCGSATQNSSWTPASGTLGSAYPGAMTSAAEDFNRSLALLASRDFVPSADYAIGPQDLLDVSLFNIDGTDGLPNKVQVRVGNDGSITLPLLGQVQAGGMTRTQLEASLRQQYGKFMHEPDVGVALAQNQSKSVYVLGAVKNPGVLPVTGQETLRRILAMAGGLTKDSGMFIHISRRMAEEERAYMISLDDLANDKSGNFNITIHAGDFINVPAAGTFYVDGYVERPSAYPLVRQYRLSEVVALAGGLAPYAKGSEITVFRRGPEAEVQVMYRDLEKIRNGQEEDIKIAENDLVVVPPSTTRIVISALLSSVGYTSRSSSYSFGIGRTGRVVGW
jgi:polysaccharide export outer membrane protein